MTTRALAVLLPITLLVPACGQNPAGPSEPRTAAAAGPPSKPVLPASPAGGIRVLYDARDRGAPVAGVERDPKLAPEVETRVLSAVSPGFKTKREDCAAGGVLLRINASASGSFTAAAARETAYVVTDEPCSPPDGPPAPAAHLVVFNGETLVVPAPGKGSPAESEPTAFVGTDLRAVVDLDQDGTSELLVTGSATRDGIPREAARLYSAKGAAIKLVKEFPGVYVDGCAGERSPGKVEAQVLRYAPAAKGSTPPITSETFEAACPESGGPKATDFKPKPPSPAPSAAATR
jgi:hypothetical protein